MEVLLTSVREKSLSRTNSGFLPRSLVVVVALALCHRTEAFRPTPLLHAWHGRLTKYVTCSTRGEGSMVKMISARQQQIGSPATTVPMAPDVRELESTIPPLPHRTITSAGYRADASKRTWPAFRYSSPAERRAAASNFMQATFERSVAEQQAAGLSVPNVEGSVSLPPALPVVKMVLIGGPCSGKGTIGPLLSQALRSRVVSVGNLLRGAVRSGTRQGQQVREVMGRGELLEDQLVLELVRSRVTDSWDAQQSGWQLVGFPRTPQQAHAIATDDSELGLRPDCVIVLDRPDELCKEFALGRMTDSATGKIYHPEYAPPPHEPAPTRLVWRSDDTLEVIDKRIATYRANLPGILAEFAQAGVPVKTVDNARSELDTFAEIAAYVEQMARGKLVNEGGWEAVFSKRYGRDRASLPIADVDPLCDLVGINAEECVETWDAGAAASLKSNRESPFLEAVRRCNKYAARDFVPVLIDNYQVGWTSREFLAELMPHLDRGRAVELVQLLEDTVPSRVAAGFKGLNVALRLAPLDKTLESRTATMAALVEELVQDGIIPQKAMRRELQDVRPISVGFRGGEAAKREPPLLRLERGAMIYCGVPSYGVHVNGYVAHPVTLRPESIWIAKRSMSKPTYPGMLDQVVAGGQPSGLTFAENCAKECEEEASLPPDVVTALTPTGLISYKYKTRKGLSTKILATFDLPMPAGVVPVCGDGEVEDFRLWKIEEALDSIKHSLPLWKPNSALVMIDFALRHGFISPDEPGFAEICHLLRAGLSIDDLRKAF